MINSRLFLEDYLFRGKHVKMVRDLTNEIDKDSSSKLFTSAIELYKASAILGCLKNKTALPENTGENFRIFTEQFVNHGSELRFIYKLVLLVNEENSGEDIDRINVAFRDNENEKNIELFESYMLGGLEEIYKYFFEEIKRVRYEDFFSGMKMFLSDNNYTDISDDEIEDDPFIDDIMMK